MDASLLPQAVTVFGQVVGYKAQYQTALADNPGLTETGEDPGNILDALHREAVDGEDWLSTNGFTEAAGVLAGSDAATAAAWLTSHPDLDTGLGVAPVGPGPSVPPPGLPGVVSAWGVLVDWVNGGMSQRWWDLQGVIDGLGG